MIVKLSPAQAAGLPAAQAKAAAAYQARLVQLIDGDYIVDNFGPEVDLIAAMAVRGFEFRKFNANPAHRAELQGAPVFANLAGPMWDGDCLRYEAVGAYRALSA